MKACKSKLQRSQVKSRQIIVDETLKLNLQFQVLTNERFKIKM